VKSILRIATLSALIFSGLTLFAQKTLTIEIQAPPAQSCGPYQGTQYVYCPDGAGVPIEATNPNGSISTGHMFYDPMYGGRYNVIGFASGFEGLDADDNVTAFAQSSKPIGTGPHGGATYQQTVAFVGTDYTGSGSVVIEVVTGRKWQFFILSGTIVISYAK
jgi:hypothetical protein